MSLGVVCLATPFCQHNSAVIYPTGKALMRYQYISYSNKLAVRDYRVKSTGVGRRGCVYRLRSENDYMLLLLGLERDAWRQR